VNNSVNGIKPNMNKSAKKDQIPEAHNENKITIGVV